MPVGKEDVAKFFDVNGYISPLDVLNLEEVKELRAQFNKCEEEIGKIYCCCWLLLRWYIVPFSICTLFYVYIVPCVHCSMCTLFFRCCCCCCNTFFFKYDIYAEARTYQGT